MVKRLIDRFLRRDRERYPQTSMWEAMQRSGYFRQHPVYRSWSAESSAPPLVLKADNTKKTGLPWHLKDIDFSADEIVFDLPDDPVETFNRVIDPVLKETEELWLQKIVRLNHEMTVLDIGCGYGRTAEWMWRHVKEISGVDISRYIIEVCRERFVEIDNARFYYNEGNDLSMFGPQRFDFVYSFNLFQHIPRKFTDSYLKEIRRLLKEGGICLFNVLSGMNYDIDNGASGAEWAIGYRREVMERKVMDAGLRVTRLLTWGLKGVEPCWLWFLVKR